VLKKFVCPSIPYLYCGVCTGSGDARATRMEFYMIDEAAMLEESMNAFFWSSAQTTKVEFTWNKQFQGIQLKVTNLVKRWAVL